jgi:hypothetical protein
MGEQEKQPTTGVKAAETKAKKLVTPEEFMTRWPLYTPAAMEIFYVPERISFRCNSPKCGKETTWMKSGPTQTGAVEGGLELFHWVCYICGLCNVNLFGVIYRELERRERATNIPVVRPSSGLTSRPEPPRHKATVSVVTQVQKIGQYPALSIDIPRELEKNLGKDHTELYKRALINRNDGYGLGAVIYLRRVVEDKTDDLIEVVAKQAEARGVDPEVIKPIRAAKEQRTTFDQKLKIAALALPESVIVEGVNTLDVLYGLVSAGLHDLTEEQCIAIADEIKRVFEFTFTHLRAEVDERKDFVADLKKLSEKLSGIRVPKATGGGTH